MNHLSSHLGAFLVELQNIFSPAKIIISTKIQ